MEIIWINCTNGVLNGLLMSGLLYRRTITATETKINAASVQIFTSSTTSFIGINAAYIEAINPTIRMIVADYINNYN